MSDFYKDEFPLYWEIPTPKITPFQGRLINPTEEQLINQTREYPISFFESMYDKKPKFNGSLWGYYMAILGKSQNVYVIVDDRVMTRPIINKKGETFYIDYYQRAYIEPTDVPATDYFVSNKEKVLKGRKLRSEKDKKGYGKQKSLSFAVSGSAVYPLNTPSRVACNIAYRNQLLFLDFDFDFEDDLVFIFEILKADKYSKMVHRSFSGDGFVVVVEMTEKDACNNFKLVFKKLEKYYKDTYNLAIDTACSDITRLRYISFDPDIFIKQNTLVEITQEELDVDNKQRKQAFERTSRKIAEFERKQKDNPTQFRSVSDLVDEIILTENRLVDGYENWLQIARSLNDYPIEWDRLNQWRNAEKYHNVLNSANEKGSNATVGTFYYYCKEAGISITQRIKEDCRTNKNLKFLFS